MLPHWFLLLPINLIYQSAKLFQLDPILIAAIISVESNGETCATRYEPHFKWFYNATSFAAVNKTTVRTESVHQQTSWGLMQVMGAVARELGHKKPLLKLCDPKTGIYYGSLKLKKLYDQYGELDKAVSSYNQGSPIKNDQGLFRNQDYVNKVTGKINEIKMLKPYRDTHE